MPLQNMNILNDSSVLRSNFHEYDSVYNTGCLDKNVTWPDKFCIHGLTRPNWMRGRTVRSIFTALPKENMSGFSF